MTILLANVRGLRSHCEELSAYLARLEERPCVVCLNETFLDASVAHISVPGYAVVSRRDRRDGRLGGGILTLVRADLEALAVQVLVSEDAERSWILFHTARGPVLVCNWYRPPNPGDVSCILSWRQEWDSLSASAVGTAVVGDLNCHHPAWLKFSSHPSVEGRELRRAMAECNFQQLVRGPTRGEHLLDLALTDMQHTTAAVQPAIADHKCVLVSTRWPAPEIRREDRVLWHFPAADWARLSDGLGAMPWGQLWDMGADHAAFELTHQLHAQAADCIPQKRRSVQKSSEPWVDPAVVSLVAAKHAAEGSPHFAAAAKACSEGILASRAAYASRVRDDLHAMRRGSKEWWKKSRQLLTLKCPRATVPCLLSNDGEWALSPQRKAQALHYAFGVKAALPAAAENEYTQLAARPGPAVTADDLDLRCKAEAATQLLQQLRVGSATGPDLLPVRLLMGCADVLGEPIAILATVVLVTGEWPSAWVDHWVVPIHKRKARSDPSNYRGVHLSSQLSKVVERLILRTLRPMLPADEVLFGPRQFAYRAQHGSRDALCFLVLTWLEAFNSKKQVALYCSDVAGAFDRVCSQRLGGKLAAKGLPAQAVQLFQSWLRGRRARVLVEGAESEAQQLRDMVFQGTVFGPMLWNLFFEDVRRPVGDAGFEECIFADDLNAFCTFDRAEPAEEVRRRAGECQQKVHAWGAANQVTFDAGKESIHVLSTTCQAEAVFKILGVRFDAKLLMREAVEELVAACSWKCASILRARRFFSVEELVLQYKTHVLPYVEARTAAIYHAAEVHLKRLDACQSSFLAELGLSPLDALVGHNLAPLQTRRDIAMLAVVHRAALRRGPSCLHRFFVPAPAAERWPGCHSRQLSDSWFGSLDQVARSAFGLIAVYNTLEEEVAEREDLSEFQGALQARVTAAAVGGVAAWARRFSPRR